jgi:hypothetical protein
MPTRGFRRSLGTGKSLSFSNDRPLTGEHTDEILAGIGLDVQAIADLRLRNIV